MCANVNLASRCWMIRSRVYRTNRQRSRRTMKCSVTTQSTVTCPNKHLSFYKIYPFQYHHHTHQWRYYVFNFDISFGARRDCETGYERLSGKYECTDIDECENGEVVTCNMETQVCFNTPGGYKCLDILSGAAAAEAAKKCLPGFRRNTKTDECEGKW